MYLKLLVIRFITQMCGAHLKWAILFWKCPDRNVAHLRRTRSLALRKWWSPGSLAPSACEQACLVAKFPISLSAHAPFCRWPGEEMILIILLRNVCSMLVSLPFHTVPQHRGLPVVRCALLHSRLLQQTCSAYSFLDRYSTGKKMRSVRL